MNTYLAVGSQPPTVVVLLFWIILVLWALGGFAFHNNAYFIRGGSLVLVVLLAILGYACLGFN